MEKTQLQKKESLRQIRIFSESVKRSTVKDIESGRCSVSAASGELNVRPQTIYNWLYKYSPSLCKNKVLVMEEKSEAYKSKELQRRILELEAALGRKQMEIDLLNKIIDLAGEDAGKDLKKSISGKLSNGSGSTKASSTDTK